MMQIKKIRSEVSAVLASVAVVFALSHCKRDADVLQVEPTLLLRVGKPCRGPVDCPTPLTCAGGQDFAHRPTVTTCQIACDAAAGGPCPPGWVCGMVFDSPGSALPALCLK
jgi:hypothetical protein